MIYQITINEKNILTNWSIGGYIPNGIDVPEIPQEVMNSKDLSQWCYSQEKNFYLNPFKESKIIESKTALAEWLEDNPMTYIDGKMYSVTSEKQALLNGNLASYERAKAGGVEYPLKWNSTGSECVSWDYTDLLTLSLTIAAYVAPKVSKQQEIELQIKACTTVEEVNEIVINYDE